MSEVDWADPCAALAALRPALYSLLAGERVLELRHNGKVIVNHKTSIPELRAEIARLEQACAAKQGETRGKRFAIRAG